jgi:hypothetical protein
LFDVVRVFQVRGRLLVGRHPHCCKLNAARSGGGSRLPNSLAGAVCGLRHYNYLWLSGIEGGQPPSTQGAGTKNIEQRQKARVQSIGGFIVEEVIAFQKYLPEVTEKLCRLGYSIRALKLDAKVWLKWSRPRIGPDPSFLRHERSYFVCQIRWPTQQIQFQKQRLELSGNRGRFRLLVKKAV